MEPVFINITNLRLSYKETWSFPEITNFTLSLIVKADRLLWTELKATRACIPSPMSLYPETYEPVSRDIWACIPRSMNLYPETYEARSFLESVLLRLTYFSESVFLRLAYFSDSFLIRYDALSADGGAAGLLWLDQHQPGSWWRPKVRYFSTMFFAEQDLFFF